VTKIGKIGEHPDYDLWPREAKFPRLGPSRTLWMACSDGCFFVNVDRPEMLIPVAWYCDVCGAPIHPDDQFYENDGDALCCQAHRFKGLRPKR